MSVNAWTQLTIFLVILIASVKPLGWYMARVYQGQGCGLDRILGWLERTIYRLAGVEALPEMGWKTYTLAALLFNAPVAHATVRHVPADFPTIQAAIAASADGDRVLVAPGFYAERIDFLFFVHDRHEGNKAAMRGYLSWETGLLDQLDDEERASFRLPAGAH